MKISESEMNNLVLSFMVKTEHEQSKELKALGAKVTQFKKDLGEAEAEINDLNSVYFEARENLIEQQAIADKIMAKQAQKTAIKDQIEQHGIITAKLELLHQDQLVLKLLKRNKKCSVKAVESMLKATSV